MSCLLLLVLSCSGAKATALNAVSFGAAFADTYTTQRFQERHDYVIEQNPLTRAFQEHGKTVAYVSTATGALALSVIARRMRTSDSRVMRKLWWLPQLS